MEAYLGIDVGSVTVKFAVLNSSDELITNLYLPAGGRPVAVVQQGLGQIGRQLPKVQGAKHVAVSVRRRGVWVGLSPNVLGKVKSAEE